MAPQDGGAWWTQLKRLSGSSSMHAILCTHLVNEGSKLAVEALDLLLLLVLYALHIGVDLQVEGPEEALVD